MKRVISIAAGFLALVSTASSQPLTRLEVCNHTNNIWRCRGSYTMPWNSNQIFAPEGLGINQDMPEYVDCTLMIGTEAIATMRITSQYLPFEPETPVMIARMLGAQPDGSGSYFSLLELLPYSILYVTDVDTGPGIRPPSGRRSRQRVKSGTVRTGAYGTDYAMQRNGNTLYIKVYSGIVAVENASTGSMTFLEDTTKYYAIANCEGSSWNIATNNGDGPFATNDFYSWYLSPTRCQIGIGTPGMAPGGKPSELDQDEKRARDYRKRWPECAD